MKRVTRWGLWSRTRQRVVVGVAAMAAVAGGVGLWPASAATVAGPPTATVAQGRLAGTVKNNVAEYLGIPYAAPPTGPLRWKPPQPAASWTGTRQATKFGNQCWQAILGQEDCLYLNVYQPTTPPPTTGKRPVMVWIHGGGFDLGSGSEYDPSIYARQGEVAVTFNYRIGVFGFLGLPSLAAESPDHASGNYGLMDQQAALRWVQQNIAAFGGDPHNVTIFGESAGGGSVCAQLASPTAAGLFQRAIAESGCAVAPVSQQQIAAAGTAFAKAVGCTDQATAAACLRTKPVNTLFAKAGTSSVTWIPSYGDSVLPLPIYQAFAQGKVNKVPVINGTNHDEGNLFIGLIASFVKITPQEYPTVLKSMLGASLAPKVEALYPLSNYASPSLALGAVMTDEQFTCPSYEADRLLSAAGLPVYAYEFNDPHPAGYDAPGVVGSGHGAEMAYVFQYPVFSIFMGRGSNPTPFSPAQLALSNTMVGYWSRMAVTGNPNGAGAPAWPTFSADEAEYLELTPAGVAATNTVAPDHHCDFWLPLNQSFLHGTAA